MHVQNSHQNTNLSLSQKHAMIKHFFMCEKDFQIYRRKVISLDF